MTIAPQLFLMYLKDKSFLGECRKETCPWCKWLLTINNVPSCGPVTILKHLLEWSLATTEPRLTASPANERVKQRHTLIHKFPTNFDKSCCIITDNWILLYCVTFFRSFYDIAGIFPRNKATNVIYLCIINKSHIELNK